MARPTHPRPTDAELSILRVLWRLGPSTVRAVHEQMQPQANHGYTTVLKMLQIMAEKGLVTRDTTRRAHVYTAAASEDATQRDLVRDLLERAFDGSAGQLALRALAERRATPEEIAEIRRLLAEDDLADEDGETSP
jgi:predicted transcriptional regulator